MADTRFAYLSSSRLVLRRLSESDLSSFCDYRSDPRVARYQDWTSFQKWRAAVSLSGEAPSDMPGTQFRWRSNSKTGELVGDCGLHTPADRLGQAEIGFTLAPVHQGRGYATEAINCLLAYVFDQLGKHRVIAITDARNAPAARVLERVGMRREGHFIKNVWFKGRWGDEYLYALLEQEWRESGSQAMNRYRD